MKNRRNHNNHYSKNYQNSQERSQQLNLFTLVPEQTEREDPRPYPLQIKSIPDRERVKPQWNCQVAHYESDLTIPGQFTIDEAPEILEITRYWDFTIDKDRIPRCRNHLLSLLEKICKDRSSSNKQEVAA